MNTSASVLPQVNGVVLAYPNEGLTTEALRQRACAELLRQAAIQAGLLAADDPLPLGGAMTELPAQPSKRCWTASCTCPSRRTKPFADTTRPSAAATPWVNVHSCATCCLPSRRAWM